MWRRRCSLIRCTSQVLHLDFAKYSPLALIDPRENAVGGSSRLQGPVHSFMASIAFEGAQRSTRFSFRRTATFAQ
jgi:hypothetical protein